MPAPAGQRGISVAADRGVSELLVHLDGLVREEFAATAGSLVNERQQQAVAGCAAALESAIAALDSGLDEQLVLVDLYRASTSLGLLTGAITQPEVFEEIFTKFCIGK